MRTSHVVPFTLGLSAALVIFVMACESESAGPGSDIPDAGSSVFDGSTSGNSDGAVAQPDATQGGTDAGSDASSDAGDAGVILPDGLIDPVPYKSRQDSPFLGVVLATYDHFEDWEDGAVNTPGVTPSSTEHSSGSPLSDSVDGDDGVVDGKCEKPSGTCDSGFSSSGTISFTFDATLLGGQLPTHVGIAWTDGSTSCDAIFEAYDATDVLIGTRTATAVGDASNYGTVDEDRYFAVVHLAGVRRIVVKSSGGGVEVDHLHYGR